MNDFDDTWCRLQFQEHKVVKNEDHDSKCIAGMIKNF